METAELFYPNLAATHNINSGREAVEILSTEIAAHHFSRKIINRNEGAFTGKRGEGCKRLRAIELHGLELV